MNETYIKLNNLSYAYKENIHKENKVFEHLNATFEIGKRTAIMAPSGKGKTTLLFLLAGLLIPDAGNIEYSSGMDILSMDTLSMDTPSMDTLSMNTLSAPKLAMVFQENRLLEQQSILCNMQFANEKLTAAEVSDMLKLAGLNYSPTQKVCKLSGGEKRRVAILRALMSEYELLLLDEPFTGLDDATKHSMMELVLKETAQKTVILVTHDKAEAEFLGCRIESILNP